MNEKGQKPFSFQEETWDLYAQNFSGLVVAPTGLENILGIFSSC
jgi:ATP-dependent Lhr-like helicase